MSITIIYLISLILFDYGFLKFLDEKKAFAGDYGSGYSESAKGANSAMQKFKAYPNYQELYLSYFLPIEYFHGYMPIAKMIFPYNQLKQSQQARELQFSKNPTNPMLALQIFAYYTQSPDPSWDYVTMLHIKNQQDSWFGFIYQQVLNEYLEFNLKRVYETPDFWLLYPRHWSSNIIPNGVTLTDGTVAVDIQRQLFPVPQSRMLGRNYYTISLHLMKDNQQEKNYSEDVLKEITSSIRILPSIQKQSHPN